jgi:hypothetical protein
MNAQLPTQSNFNKFTQALELAYVDLFTNDPEYSYSAAVTTPQALASKMASYLMTGDANKDGEGIKRACKVCGIKQTYKAISAFLQA